MKINQLVTWLNCPPAISTFAESQILELSTCGQFARIAFIYHWIPLAELEPSDCPKSAAFWSLYQNK